MQERKTIEMLYQDEGSLKLLISRYQQRIFALVLYLLGGDRDKAYDIAASSFVEAIRTTSSLFEGGIFLTRLVSAAVKKSQQTKIIPSSDESDFLNLSSEERASLRIIKIVLQKLPFNTRVLLLLRDQLHLAHKDIATILRISQKNAKTQTIQARIKLRKNIEEVLLRGG